MIYRFNLKTKQKQPATSKELTEKKVHMPALLGGILPRCKAAAAERLFSDVRTEVTCQRCLDERIKTAPELIQHELGYRSKYNF